MKTIINLRDLILLLFNTFEKCLDIRHFQAVAYLAHALSNIYADSDTQSLDIHQTLITRLHANILKL